MKSKKNCKYLFTKPVIFLQVELKILQCQNPKNFYYIFAENLVEMTIRSFS